MTEIPMTWSPANRERVLARKKLVTTRRTPHGVRGDHFILDGRRFVFVAIRPLRLGHVAEFYFQMEGCASSEEFLDEWVVNYGLLRPPNLTDTVYLHEFREDVVIPSPPG
jgi:hypothetical protein